MNAGDIVRVVHSGEHNGRYGVVREVSQSPDSCLVELEDDHQMVTLRSGDVEFVRRGPFRSNPR
jgi:hypothetical protein